MPPDQVRKIAAEAGRDMKKSAGTVTRVVERGDRAVAIFPGGQWSTFVKEGGVWKSDD